MKLSRFLTYAAVVLVIVLFKACGGDSSNDSNESKTAQEQPAIKKPPQERLAQEKPTEKKSPQEWLMQEELEENQPARQRPVQGKPMLVKQTQATQRTAVPFNVTVLEREVLKITTLDDVNLWDIRLNMGNCQPYGYYGTYVERVSNPSDNKTMSDILRIIRAGTVYTYKYKNGTIQLWLKNGTQLWERSHFWKLADQLPSQGQPSKNKLEYEEQMIRPVHDYRIPFQSTKHIETNCEEILEAELTTDTETWKFSFN